MSKEVFEHFNLLYNRYQILSQISDERERQDAKWGDQSGHPDGTGGADAQWLMRSIQELCDRLHAQGADTWMVILAEEVLEAFGETDKVKLRTELVQVAAVAVNWIEAIDRRSA